MPKEDPDKRMELPRHGARILPSVVVESYNLEVEDEDGFIGDKASKGAFWEFVDKWRNTLSDLGEDPFGGKPSGKVGKRKLADMLAEGDADAAALVHSAVEDFAKQLAAVIRRYMRLKSWRETECIVVGGGFRGSRVGEIAVARAGLLLRADGSNVVLEMIRNDPDEAGLLGAVHLLPAWMLKGHDAILAVDVGGTNIRAGIVELNLEKSSSLDKAKIVRSILWRHANEGVDRESATDRLIEMLKNLVPWARKNKIELAPVIGVGCPGIIKEDGSIERGGQNLPGNWESSRFNLPDLIRAQIPKVEAGDTMVVMHNDAVVQGLSEMPYVAKRRRWAVLTIGTGLGNACFTARAGGNDE